MKTIISKEDLLERVKARGRPVVKTTSGQGGPAGPLEQLVGTWRNLPNTPDSGWNMLALPIADGPSHYRLLVNRFSETLVFTALSRDSPKGEVIASSWAYGKNPEAESANEGDQFVLTLDYEQSISRIASDAYPKIDLAAIEGDQTHHGTRLWSHIDHGEIDSAHSVHPSGVQQRNSILVLGSGEIVAGPPVIPDLSGLPEGVGSNLNNPDLAPYKHFNENLFQGLFNPVSPNDLLSLSNEGVNIVKSQVLEVDTTSGSGGIQNVPSIMREANTTEMKSTFWMQELADEDVNGKPILRLQYSQVVFLDFFRRRDGAPGLIRWPYISINTLEKVPDQGSGTD